MAGRDIVVKLSCYEVVSRIRFSFALLLRIGYNN